MALLNTVSQLDAHRFENGPSWRVLCFESCAITYDAVFRSGRTNWEGRAVPGQKVGSGTGDRWHGGKDRFP